MAPGSWESGVLALPQVAFANLLCLMGTPVCLICEMEHPGLIHHSLPQWKRLWPEAAAHKWVLESLRERVHVLTESAAVLLAEDQVTTKTADSAPHSGLGHLSNQACFIPLKRERQQGWAGRRGETALSKHACRQTL